jgi:hypothetical protein
MEPMSITGLVNDQHLLSAQVPASIPPGPVTILIVTGAPLDEVDANWMNVVAQSWADDLNDPRQDIYSLADGDSADEA